jgi:lipopolysaccharide/colanic/teichoic acid biosynthesis glycosyltransferase
MLRRLTDIICSLVLGVLALPIVALAAIAIWFADPGPIFYKQRREGLNGRQFWMWKLRTMYVHSAEILSVHLRSNPDARREWNTYLRLAKDPRIIGGVGHFLRHWSIDELPQLWNVLRGDMTLVGPRPFAIDHLEHLTAESRRLRSMVRPGLTGLWQVSGRSSTSIEEMEQLDLRYLRERSLALDCKILLKTVRAIASREGAY